MTTYIYIYIICSLPVFKKKNPPHPVISLLSWTNDYHNYKTNNKSHSKHLNIYKIFGHDTHVIKYGTRIIEILRVKRSKE